MQSGISVSAELQDAFARFSSDNTSFCLPVTITSERLTPLDAIPFPGSSSSPEDFFSALPSLFRPAAQDPNLPPAPPPRPSSSALVALTYIPSNAPVRPKMLFASTRQTLTRELGTEKFASSVFATEEEEILGREAWRERDGETTGGFRREDLMDDKERELEAVRKAEAEARNSTRHRDIGIGGHIWAWFWVWLRHVRTETVQLVEAKADVDPGSVASHISEKSPRYSYYHYPGTEVVVFVYTCPSGSSIKERMVHASSRRTAITIAENEGLKIEKKVWAQFAERRRLC
ncbi:hypothetical protein N7470_003487 [Penicillium chermesinum]|nr:hypothetical protein N7470_003487 [Penicillium chermesinum]